MTQMFDEVMADLQELNAENLGPSTVQLEVAVSTRIPGTAEYSDVWIADPEQLCRFNAATAKGSNFRLDQPAVVGDWTVVLAAGQPAKVGQRALVRGKEIQAEVTVTVWQRLLSVVKVVGPQDNAMLTKLYCVDVELVP